MDKRPLTTFVAAVQLADRTTLLHAQWDLTRCELMRALQSLAIAITLYTFGLVQGDDETKVYEACELVKPWLERAALAETLREARRCLLRAREPMNRAERSLRCVEARARKMAAA